uniref:Putative salivary secreted peptide n=1 Tax=Culex tarsalis TaxID=7177 RepID=A0A1Q3FME1_CULTA
MAINKVLVCSILVLLLVSFADSAKECFQCFGGPADCDAMVKVQCSRENATQTALQMSPIYPDVITMAPESDSYYCAEASYSVFISDENPNLPEVPGFPAFEANTKVVYKVKGCIFEPTGNICKNTKPVNGEFSCRYCSSDNCNSAFSLASSLLVLISCLMLTRIFSN